MDRSTESPSESKERAVSSEPCSTRPNPFDDDGSSARKRRRTSLNGVSPSRSVDSPNSTHDTFIDSSEAALPPDQAERDASMTMNSAPSEPRTPEPIQHEQVQPTSGSRPTRITLNLKNRKQESHFLPSSPISSNGADLGPERSRHDGIRLSVEDSELEVSHTLPDFRDTGSPSLDIDNPPIEIIDDDDDDDDDDDVAESPDRVSQVILLQDPDGEEPDPVTNFPYNTGDPVAEALSKLCSQYMPTNINALNMMRNWLDDYLTWASTKDRETVRQNQAQYQDFWQLLPLQIVQHSSPQRNHLPRNQQFLHMLNEMHVSFAKLTAFLIELDCSTLDVLMISEDGWRDILSAQYALYLNQLLLDYAQTLSPNMMEWEADSYWPEMLTRILDGYRSLHPVHSRASAQSLCRLGCALAEQVPRFPKLVESLSSIAQLTSYLIRDDCTRLQSDTPASSDSNKALSSQGYELYDAGSRALAVCIDKSVNQILPTVAESLISGLTDTLRICLRAGCDKTQDLIRNHQQIHPEIPPTESANVIVAEWRLATLTKLIMSSQMQLRILAAGYLCTDLVRVWKDHHEVHLDLSQHPVLRHISRQLLDSGVVAYVLGPTCHPEVTLSSGNIIGFLFVTNTFTEEHLDFLWNTVTTCQVSGVAESLLTMLGGISNLLPAQDILCIVRKLHSIPIEDFTPTMKDFADKLMSHLSERPDRGLGLLPYSFMFKLLRESSAPGPPFFQVVQRWAASLIVSLLRHGPSPEDRFLLYKECIQDLDLKTRYTLGSLHGLWLLCRPVSRERDLQQLTAQFNLPKLLVNELEHAVESRDSTGVVHVISGPQNAPRLDLLMTIIIHGPETITRDLGRRLWELFVGNQSTTLEDKDCAWQSLSNAMKTWPANRFLQVCFSEYFPSLSPELFRPGTLEFVLQKILPALNHENSMILYEEDSDDRLAIEQLWKIALKAPNGTIERRAIAALVKDVYMESRSIQALPLHRARNVHLMLVDRCMRQLSSAAEQLTVLRGMAAPNGLDAVTIEADRPILEHELLFTRSLTIVREFHKLHQQTAHFSSPDMRSLVLPQTSDVVGDSAELKLQSFDGDIQTDVKPLTIGRRNTAGSLLASIRDATGFDNYRLYYKGRALLPTEKDICRSLEDLEIHDGLILVKREVDASEAPVHVRPGASPVEIEIMRHFQELWEFLALEEKLASEIYAFLVTLPVDDRILCVLESETTTYQDVFSIGHPLKSLYALHAIRDYLSSQSALAKLKQEKILYDGALRRVIGLVTLAISDRAVIDDSTGAELKAALATRLVEQLLAIMRDPSRPLSMPEFLNAALIERLLELLTSSLATDSTSIAPTLIAVTFHAILEACSLKMDIWVWLQSKVDMGKVALQLLLVDDRELVRRSTATIIGDKVTNTASSAAVPASAFRGFFLPLIMRLIPFALDTPRNSLELFNLAVIFFRPPTEATSAVIDLRATVQSLSGLLLEYDPTEVASVVLALPSPRLEEPLSSHNLTQPGGIDVAAYGLVNLLHCILCAGPSDASILEILPSDFASTLFWRRLFVRQLTNADLLWQGNLIYNEATRARLNDIILKVAGRDLYQLKILLEDMNWLVACKPTNKWSDDGPIYRYDLPFYFDRAKALRAPTGYAGLRNLSNTCYLNSLCTQLFMNIDFRQFMLSADVDSRDRSRTLLSQTQWLFGQLQSSNQRSVDPEDFVSSIKTYDDDIINIHHQMDVEEFFNLLNDRWEAQLRSPEAVRRFRSFYGGQLVTQTKSKECDHISEVMEPFSAIQCDIKGKRSLLESLNAYVEGEHMEGDNKYKCSTCDRHVDAVRRSCLKEMPDSLIFHLKRFDFNLRTQARSKINDYFAFPERLNMQPYTIEHLSNSPEGSTEDWFELVGVLVHAGTAESGHYYSFIRERPTSRKDESWFEFNDDVVSPWDPSKMEAACFGGTETSWDNGGAQYEKNYCAYMLFYERSSALQRKQQELEHQGCSSPIQRKIQAPLSSWIKTENLKQLQRHCLFDRDHIRFLDAIFDRMLELNHGACSDDHEIETEAVKAAIAHLDQIASRVREVPDAQRLTDRIRELADNCGRCAFAIYEYFADHREAFRNLVQRNPEASVRSAVADIFLVAVISIKETYSGAYYASAVSDDSSEDFQDVVAGVCTLFEAIWNSFHILSLHRSWPEVFDMMERFLELGSEELLGFLNRDFLVKTMLVLVAPELPEQERDQQFSKFCNVLARRPNRSPNYSAVIGLLRQVLLSVVVDNPVRDRSLRERIFLKYPSQPLRLTLEECDLLHRRPHTGGNVLFDKLIYINQHPDATDDIFVHIFQHNWDVTLDILDTLLTNTAPQASYFVYAPYLRVAVLFCHWSHDAGQIDNLIGHIAQHSKVLAANEPKAVWSFFKQILEGMRHHSGESDVALEMQCLKYLPDWAPVLLIQYDLNISVLVDNILDEKIFQYGVSPQFDDEDGGVEKAKAIAKCAKRIGKECCEHVQEACISRSQSVTSQTVAILQRVLSKCGDYFDEADESPTGEAQRFFRSRHSILENLRRLSVDDLEEDGSDWENSVASSDQADSLAEDEIKEMDI